jgi:rRNA processing protein Krr1/Pno1
VADLTHVSINCEAEKMGRVIGKHGVTIKAIEKQCLVVMDVDSVSAKIHLTGPTMAIEAAIREIDKIVDSVDEDVVLDKHVIGYLTTKVCLQVASCWTG